MTPDPKANDAKIRRKFDTNAVIAAAGHPMARPRLTIVDDEQFETLKGAGELAGQVSDKAEPIAEWAKQVKPGMTAAEIRELVKRSE